MSAATFDDVITRLREEGQLNRNSGTNSLKSVKEAIFESNKTFKDGFGELLNFFQGNSLKDLEAKREQDEFNKDLLDALEDLKGGDTPAPAPTGGPSGVGALAGVGLAVPALIALVASVTGLDDELRALKIAEVFPRFAKSVATFVDGIKSFGTKTIGFVDSVRNFKPKVPELPKIGFVDIEGKPYDFNKFKLKVPELPKLRLPEIPRIALPELPKLRFPEIPRLTLPEIPKVNFPEIPKLTLPEGLLDTIQSVKNSVQNFFDKIPRIKFTMPEGVGTIGSSIAKIFGSAEEGTGVLGFLGKVFGFIEPLLAPFKKIIGVIMRPFVQVFLSLIDFVVGFYEGFTGEDGSFLDKITAGIEGGILGVIKGITDAIDLLLIDLPAWFLGKLGFDGVAEKLKEFSLTALVDPAWEAVKGFFTGMFNDPGSTLMSIGAGIGDMATEFLKTLLRMVLPDPEGGTLQYFASKAVPNFVYEFAGIDPDTGEVLPSASGQSGNELTAANAENAELAGAGAGNTTVVGGSTSVQTVNNNQTTVEPSPPPAQEPEDKKGWWW